MVPCTAAAATAAACYYPRGGHGGGYYGGYYRHYPYYYGGFYYPPFVSLYGWYPYSFGWAGWYGYGAYGPYGPYGFGPYDTTASVRVQVTPRDAQVYVDGYYAGIVDDFDGTFQRLRLLPGAHEITVYLAGLSQRHRADVLPPERQLQGGERAREARRRLAGRPQAAARAAVGLDGRLAPWRRSTIPAIPAIRCPGRPHPSRAGPIRLVTRARSARCTAHAGQPGEAGVVRRSPSASSFGSLVVRVQPDGASIVIDGERWHGPDAQERLVVQLADGRHRIEIRKDGFVPYAADVDVRTGESTVLNVSLPPVDRR